MGYYSTVLVGTDGSAASLRAAGRAAAVGAACKAELRARRRSFDAKYCPWRNGSWPTSTGCGVLCGCWRRGDDEFAAVVGSVEGVGAETTQLDARDSYPRASGGLRDLLAAITLGISG